MYRVQVRNGDREMELYFILLFYLFFPPETPNTDTQWLYKWVPALSVFYPFMLQYNGWLPFQPIRGYVEQFAPILRSLPQVQSYSLVVGTRGATLLLQKNCWDADTKRKRKKKKSARSTRVPSHSLGESDIFSEQVSPYMDKMKSVILQISVLTCSSKLTSHFSQPLCAFHICNEAQASLALENNERVNKWVAPPAG